MRWLFELNAFTNFLNALGIGKPDWKGWADRAWDEMDNPFWEMDRAFEDSLEEEMDG